MLIKMVEGLDFIGYFNSQVNNITIVKIPCEYFPISLIQKAGKYIIPIEIG